MQSKYQIPLSDLIREFLLEEVVTPRDAKEIPITSPEVSRPGLALSGFVEVFEPFRIQLIGRAEYKYLAKLSQAQRAIRLENFLKLRPVALILTTSLVPFNEMIVLCRQYEVPLLRTSERTSAFMASLIASLNTSLAPRITRHGVLVEVHGGCADPRGQRHW